MTTATPSRLSIFRLAAASAFAIVALTACNPTGGETTIESATAGDDPTTASVAASGPVGVDAASSFEPAPRAELPELTEPTEATEVPSELVPVIDDDGDSTEATDVTVEPAAADSTDAALRDAVADAVDVTVEVDEPAPVDNAVEAAPEPDESVETETATFNATGADCLEGRWIAAPGEIQLYFDTIGLASGIDMNGSGHIIIVLENGNYVYDARIVNEINVDGFPTSSVVDGVTQGNYTYENGFIVANETAGSLSAYVDAGGVRIDATDLGNDFAQAAAFHEAPYDCNGDNPSIYFDVAPGVARYEMKFIPWDGTRP